MRPTLGIIEDLPFSDYCELDGLNWSLLKNIHQSPLHYQWALTHPRADTDPMRKGRACHTSILEPTRLLRDYAIWEGRRAGKEWKAFESDNTTKTILTDKAYAEVELMQQAARRNSKVRELLDGAMPELSVQWSLDGRLCKARLDAYKQRPDSATDLLIDLKTTASLSQFQNVAARLLYHGQMAFYNMGATAAFKRPTELAIIALESAPPHDSAIFTLPDSLVAHGEALVADLLAKLTQAEESAQWVGAYPEPTELILPAWATFQDSGDFGEELLA